ncbi:MAG: NAD+ synthase [Candidatus Thorarchaeota archaeon]
MNLPEGLQFDDYEPVRKIIVDFIRDYIANAGMKRAVLGLSGGIDSSLVATLACQAIGPENVLGIILPVDAEEDAKNISDAKLVAEHLGMKHEVFELKEAVAAFDSLNLDKLAKGNLAARLRMVTWYARANQENRLVLGTSNKTELMIGYFTKYGDGGTDVLPIAELYKANVWDLSRHVGVPEPLITKAPSAGLWEGQTDEKEIGVSYPELDAIVFLHVEKGMNAEGITSWGIEKSKVEKILKMMRYSQHKRNPLARPNPRL